MEENSKEILSLSVSGGSNPLPRIIIKNITGWDAGVALATHWLSNVSNLLDDLEILISKGHFHLVLNPFPRILSYNEPRDRDPGSS